MSASSSITLMAMFGLRVGPAADRSVVAATRAELSGKWKDAEASEDKNGVKVQLSWGAWRGAGDARSSASPPSTILPALPDSLPGAANGSLSVAERDSSPRLDVSFTKSVDALYLPSPRAGAILVEHRQYPLGTIVDTYA
ncbi:MAG: hypothetical protein NTW86_17670 [Candidatus Sumerlaeota bacterium]|nr:hypothetical protein [Candidatus Sumerlaeota bacterium]